MGLERSGPGIEPAAPASVDGPLPGTGGEPADAARGLGAAPWRRLALDGPVRAARDWRRFARQCRRPFRALLLRHYEGEPFLTRLDLRDGRQLWLRAGTDDARIALAVFFGDEYRTAAAAGGGRLGVVVDVGAHIGSLSLRLQPRAERLLAFEAAPATFRVLERNLGGRRGVELFPRAVAERPGTLRFYLSPDRGAKNSLFPALVRDATEAVDVEAVALPDVLAARGVEKIDFLKLDCEGAEYGIVRSLAAWGLERIRRLAMEYHPLPGVPPADGGAVESAAASIEALEETLRRAGFRLERVPHKRRAGRGMLYAWRG